MRCWRFYLRRKFLPYMERELPPREAKRLEKHLLGCEWCRAIFARLRDGHRMAQQLRHLGLDGTHCPPEFERVKADAREIVTKPHSWARIGENWLYALATPRVVLILTALVLVQLALLVVLNRGVLFGERNAIAVKSSALDLNDFHPLSIREFQSNTRPHIAIEGYVRDVHVDKEEGTLHFRLVEIPHRSVPFVVCEIISPIGMTLPREGSRVRVYGVARYDAQPDRLWHEVNPVLDIALLKR